MPLFHKDLGFPSKMKFRALEGLTPSSHALQAARTDRYGAITIPDKFDPNAWEIVEIETKGGALDKIVARQPMNEALDLVMVLLPYVKLIKTVWINERNDKHSTLDASRYERP